MGTLLDCLCDKDNDKKDFTLTPVLNDNLISNEDSNSYIIYKRFLNFAFS